jgi:hypothetical protein
MQKTERKLFFDLGQLVATPGALATLEKSGQTPWTSSHAMWPEKSPKKTARKTN